MTSSLPSLEDVHRFLARPPFPTEFYTDSILNKKALEPEVTFAIGGVLWLISAFLWYRRLKKAEARAGGKLRGAALLRAMMGAATDNDSPIYTIISFAAISMLFLGGIQENHKLTVIIMIAYYAIVAFGESIQIFIAYTTYATLADVELVTNMDRDLEDEVEDLQGKDPLFVTTKVQPNNVYEDMGRSKVLVFMVFLTQLALIIFISMDVYRKDVVACLDGTPDCPVGWTVASYGLYVLGILQSSLYLLGPKSDYGRSEQNPAFWMVLLLAAKQKDRVMLWDDDREKEFKNGVPLRGDDGKLMLDEDGDIKMFPHRKFAASDVELWVRFAFSYLINGVGYHILVHALPIQVAASSDLITLVYRTVGMLYFVDLDDTAGMPIYITRRENTVMSKGDEIVKDDATEATDISEMTKEAQTEADKIVAEAEEELRALMKRKPSGVVWT